MRSGSIYGLDILYIVLYNTTMITSMSVPTRQKMYQGDIEMVFTPESHYYEVYHKGIQKYGVRGVTTILQILDKPALMQWAANMASEHWREGIKAGTDELTLDRLSREAPLAWKIKRDTAGQIGTLIHKWIEEHIGAKIAKVSGPVAPVNEIMYTAVTKFLQWEKDNVGEYLFSEKKLYSIKHNVAGTCDFIYLDKAGKRSLGDLKTSNSMQRTFDLQLAAYRYMLEEENPSEVYENMVIVRVGKDEGKIQIKKVDSYKDNLKAFLCCVILNNILKPEKKL